MGRVKSHDFSLEIIDTLEYLDSWKDEWGRLSSHSEEIGLARNLDFVASFWEAFRGGSKLRILVVKDRDGRWVLASPMRIEVKLYRGIPMRTLGFLENGYMPSCGMLLNRDYTDDALPLISAELLSFREWDLVQLPKVRRDSVLMQYILEYADAEKLRHGVLPSIETPVIHIDGTWEDLLKARSRSFRKQLRKKHKRFDQLPGATIDAVYATPENARELVEKMSDVSARSWKRQTATDLSSSPASQFFLERLLRRMSAGNDAVVWFAFKDKHPIAYELHLRQGTVTYPLRADFDEAYQSISPGSVLEATIIQNLFDTTGIELYYSCGITYRYLMRWTDQTVKHNMVEIFAPRFLSKLGYHLEYGLMPILRCLGNELSGNRES